MSRLGRWWWVALPRLAGRFSRGVAFSLADGHYLAAWPRAAVLVPGLGALVGLVLGALSLGYDTMYTESLVILMGAAALGFVSAGAGIAFVAGFAVGDFLIANFGLAPPLMAHGLFSDGLPGHLLYVRVPLLIGYAVLAVLAVALPRLSRTLLADLPKARALGPEVAFAIAVVLTAVIGAVLCTLWTQTAAVLIRPVFTWSGGVPTAEAVAPLQVHGTWVAGTAVVATLVRSILLWLVERDQERRGRVRAVEAALAAEGGPSEPLLERPPVTVRAVAAAAATTLLLSGMLSPWWLAAPVFASLLAAGLVRHQRGGPRLQRWRALVARVPLLARLAIGFVLVQTLGALVERITFDADSFLPVALFVTAAVLVFTALLPGPPQAPRTDVTPQDATT